MLKKIIALSIAASFAGCGPVYAQEVVDTQNVTVITADCTKQESESLVGAGIGSVGGAVAGNVLGGLFGKSGRTIGTLAGGAAGAYVGNEMGKNVVYSCELLVQGVDKKFITQYKGNTLPVVSKQYVLYKLSDGSVKLK